MTEETKENQENIISDNSTSEQDNPKSELEQKITSLEESNKDLNDKLLRLAAELENIRKRGREEIEKASKYAVSNFAGDLVLVVENFYLASENLPELEIDKSPAVKHFVDAVMMTKKELTKTLEKYNIKRIFPLGENFDHNYHEAISQVEVSENEESGSIRQVIQAGYIIGERLIRPALVVVTN
jgi:molecular chaperone GrpE